MGSSVKIVIKGSNRISSIAKDLYKEKTSTGHRLSTSLCYLLLGTYQCTSLMSQPAELSPLWEAGIGRFNNILCMRRGPSASQFLLRTAPNLGLGVRDVRSLGQECSSRMFRDID